MGGRLLPVERMRDALRMCATEHRPPTPNPGSVTARGSQRITRTPRSVGAPSTTSVHTM